MLYNTVLYTVLNVTATPVDTVEQQVAGWLMGGQNELWPGGVERDNLRERGWGG